MSDDEHAIKVLVDDFIKVCNAGVEDGEILPNWYVATTRDICNKLRGGIWEGLNAVDDPAGRRLWHEVFLQSFYERPRHVMTRGLGLLERGDRLKNFIIEKNPNLSANPLNNLTQLMSSDWGNYLARYDGQRVYYEDSVIRIESENPYLVSVLRDRGDGSCSAIMRACYFTDGNDFNELSIQLTTNERYGG